MPPGHVPSAVAGSDFVIFSPKDELAVTDAAIAANVAKMMAAFASADDGASPRTG